MDNVRHIEWATYGATVLHPLTLVITVVLCLVVFRTKREYVVLPLLISMAMITHHQRVVVFDLDFSMQRIVVLVALVRLIVKKEYSQTRILALDKVVLFWVAASVVISVVATPTISTFLNRLGFAVDSVVVYGVTRICVRSPSDLVVALRMLAWVLIPVALEMTYESLSGRNLFHFMGAPDFVPIRDGRLRCLGAMGHPILAGSFGASAVPLMISLTLQGDRSRVLGLIGAVAGVVITVTSASSGPALCLLAGLAAWGMWFARRGLRVFLYGSVVLLGFIHLVRDKPVWHLIGRMSDLIGGTGYHRVKLIDAAVDHFGEWWLIGSKNSMNWGWGLQDTTNWYISNGLQGGLLTLVAFLATLVMSFRSVGAARRMSRKLRKRDIRAGKKLEYLAWGLGASLFSHCFAWLSVSYFGTMKLLFFLQLAFFAALASPVLVRRRSGKAPNRIKRLADPSESPGSSGLSPLLKRAMPAVQRPDGQRGPNL